MKLAPGTEFSTKNHQTTCDLILPGWNEEEIMRRLQVLLTHHLFMIANIIFTRTMTMMKSEVKNIVRFVFALRPVCLCYTHVYHAEFQAFIFG